MTFELIVPELTKRGTAKDFIIAALTKDWPLSLKELHNKIKKEFKFSGSYQSVFKGANELIEKKVLIKKGKEYEINISWAKELQHFTDVIETNYFAENKTKEFNSKVKKGEDTVILNFNSLFDAEKYLYYFVKNELKKNKNNKVFYEMNNLWKVLFYYRAEYNYYTKLMKLGHKFNFLVAGNSKVEEKAKAFYKKLGIKVRAIEELPTDNIIFGDFYIQVFIPEKLKEKMSTFLSKEKEFDLLTVLDEEYMVKVIIHKDKSLAEGIREKLSKRFQ